ARVGQDKNAQPLIYVIATVLQDANPPTADLCLCVFGVNGELVLQSTLRRGEEVTQGPVAVIGSQLTVRGSSRASAAASAGDQLRGAAVIDTMLFVGIARASGTPTQT